MGLEGKLNGQQASKKWENLKRKYKVSNVVLLKSLTISILVIYFLNMFYIYSC